MPGVTYADPTTTRTPLNFDVMPPIKQASPITDGAPIGGQQDAPGQLARPIDYHAQPKYTPNIQQQIIDDGANWKTIDINPRNTSVPSPRINNNTSQSVLAGTNVVSGNSFAQEQALEAAAYYGGWALSGFWDGAIEGRNYPNEQLRIKRDTAEDAAYTIGQKVGEELRNLGQDGVNRLEDLWKNKPQFEIPTIKIPKFEQPGLPDIFKPKPKPDPEKKPDDKPIPGQPEPTGSEPEQKPEPEQKEKDIPRLTEPAPKPIPKNLTRQLRELELSLCGNISFGIAYTYKITGSYFDTQRGITVFNYHLTTLEEVYSAYLSVEGSQPYVDIFDFVASSGGTG